MRNSSKPEKKRQGKVLTVSNGAEGVHWNLTDLYAGPDALGHDLEKARTEVSQFAQRYRNQLSLLNSQELAQALSEFERLQILLGRAAAYSYLHWCTNTEDESRGALLQKTRETSTQLIRAVLFFELEWLQLDESRVSELLSSPDLQLFRHYLELERLRVPHVLSEPEEKILTEKSLTGRSAWSRFFDQIVGATRFLHRNRKLTLQELLSHLYDSDRTVRKNAALTFSRGLENQIKEITFISNTILADKSTDDRLRKYPHWLTSRNLDNEISSEAVAILVHSVTSRYDLVARHYDLKKKVLGLEKLWDYDRYAPLDQTPDSYSWSRARNIVLEAYGSFHPDMKQIASLFFDQQWIDAPPTPGKVGGAFSHQTIPPVHPYILLNYTGTIRDVQTLAHELGHGVHQYLSRKQGLLQSRTPLTTSETASVFGEMLVFDYLLRNEHNPKTQLSLLMSTIDDTMATVFRQIAMHCFEDRVHTVRRTEGELSVDRFNEIWMETQKEMFQGSVSLGRHYCTWWSYIPHFIHTPGYVYAYAFGKLLVMSLYTRFKQNGPDFVKEYLQLLESGSSDWPHVLFSRLGIDIMDQNFWDEGLSAIEQLINQAEELASNK